MVPNHYGRRSVGNIGCHVRLAHMVPSTLLILGILCLVLLFKALPQYKYIVYNASTIISSKSISLTLTNSTCLFLKPSSMTPPRTSFHAENLLFLALSFFAIVVAFNDGPRITLAQNSNNSNAQTISVNIGVVLDMSTWMGQMGLSCINMALLDFYGSNPSYKTRLVLNVRDSKRDEVAAAAAGSLSLSLSSP